MGIKTDHFETQVGLLEQLKTSAADDTPWHEFKKIYWDLIAGWARMYGCTKEQIRDIFQETMFCLMRDIQNIDNLRKEGGFRHYLRKLVLNCVIDALSRATSEAVPNGKKTAVTHKNEDDLWKKSVISRALEKASIDAGETACHAFCYIDIDGMTVQSAAQKLELSEDRTSKLRNHFLKVLKEDCHSFMSSIEEEEVIDELLGSDDDFIKTIKYLTSGLFDFKHTMLKDDMPPIKLLGRMNFVKEQLKSNPAKANNTTNLLLITRKDKILPDGTKKNTLETALKEKSFDSRWIELKHYQIIGRLETCHVTLQGEGISRFHASIIEKRNGWSVKDEQSTNGVYINGKKVKDSILKNGDIIQISPRYLMIFSLRNLNEYMDLQLKYIRWWSQHFKVSMEQAAWDWVKTDLAVKFAGKYRKQSA